MSFLERHLGVPTSLRFGSSWMGPSCYVWVFYLVFDCGFVVLGRAGEIVSQKVVDKTKIFDAQVSNIRVPRNVPAEGSLERG